MSKKAPRYVAKANQYCVTEISNQRVERGEFKQDQKQYWFSTLPEAVEFYLLNTD